MRKLFLALVLVVSSITLVGATPGKAEARPWGWWRGGYTYYPSYYYGTYTYPSYAWGTYYTPSYPVYSYGYYPTYTSGSYYTPAYTYGSYYVPSATYYAWP